MIKKYFAGGCGDSQDESVRADFISKVKEAMPMRIL